MVRLRIALWLLKCWIVVKSHPLRVRILLSFLLCLLALFAFRHYLWIHVPRWIWSLSHPLLLFASTRPLLGRVLHFLYNALPDIAFVLLAIAGLAYLVPKKYLDRLEELIWVRIFLIVVFLTFGFAAIIINAAHHEEEDNTQAELRKTITEQGTKMNEVHDSNAKILEYFVSNRSMSEVERRENIEKTLRNEYILSHNPIDPEILAGGMPPDDWTNRRLRELGEKWAISTSNRPTPQITQSSPEEKKAKVVFSFFQLNMSGEPQTVKFDPISDDKFSVSISAIVRGDVPAENLQVWIRECETCEWESSNSPGLNPGDADHPFDKGTFIPELQPNVASPRWNVAIKLPHYPRYDSVAIGCYYSCKNCAPVDWAKPQVLWVTRTMQAGFRLLSPSISYTPEPVH